jgi:hypothetical protein
MATATDQFEPAAPVERLLAASAGAVIAGGAAGVAYFDPTKLGFLPVCPLYAMTGFACPGCGLTRGFHALFHGDILTALDHNAMLPYFAFLIGCGFVALLYYAVSGRRLPFNPIHPKVLWVFLVLLLVFGVARNLPWYPFSVLFP